MCDTWLFRFYALGQVYNDQVLKRPKAQGPRRHFFLIGGKLLSSVVLVSAIECQLATPEGALADAETPDSLPSPLPSRLPREHTQWAWPSGRVRVLTGEFLCSTTPPSAPVPPPTPRLARLYLQTQVNLQ